VAGDDLTGAWNFRDVAEETGIRPGRFYRSSELSRLSEEGGRRLLQLGITDVADLRSLREVEKRGSGLVPDGVEIHLLPFHELSDRSPAGTEAPHEYAFERMLTEAPAGESGEGPAVAAGRFMTEEYRRFPALAGAHLAVRQVISMLADERPVITHCFAGKDRTGFTVAVTLEAAGVGDDAIMADFLRSNEAVPRLRDRIVESIRNRAGENVTDEIITFAEAQLTEEVLGVREDYLVTARRTIDEDYGSLPNYLDALGVTSEQVDRLRASLLA
jgi:protein-tyrosine phosphatase